MSIIERLKSWYRGAYVPPPENDPNSRVIFISPGHHQQPALAKFIGIVGRFYLAHWQWIIATTLAVLALVVAL